MRGPAGVLGALRVLCQLSVDAVDAGTSSSLIDFVPRCVWLRKQPKGTAWLSAVSSQSGRDARGAQVLQVVPMIYATKLHACVAT